MKSLLFSIILHIFFLSGLWTRPPSQFVSFIHSCRLFL